MARIARFICFWSLILFLTGCEWPHGQRTGALPLGEVARESTSFSTPSTRVVLPTVSATPIAHVVPSAIVPSSSAVLGAAWTTVTWQGLVIPLPSQSQWQEHVAQDADQVAPVVARGAITYLPTSAGVEQQYGPVFTVYLFSDSLDSWLALQQRRGDLFVDQSTIDDTILALRPAKRYQPVVTGTCNSGFYIMKVDATHLVEVATQCLDTAPYTTVINQLRFQAP